MNEVRAHIDSEASLLVDQTMALSRLNSGSRHLAGLAATADAVEALIADLGVVVERMDTDPMQVVEADGTLTEVALGQVLRATRDRPGRPSLLLVSHYDTVFGADHPFQRPRRVDGRLEGPGVADDKGGIAVMLAALRALYHSSRDDFGWEILLNPDEELGSPGSRRILREAALRHSAGLVFEPSLPGGDLAAERKGSGTYDLVVRGAAAHAGRDHHLGRNAVVAAAQLVQRLAALTGTRQGLTVNVSAIDGGTAVNIVPDRAVVRFNARVADQESQHLVERAVAELCDEASGDGITVRAFGGFGRPPKPVTAEIGVLFGHAQAEATELGIDLDWHSTGGVCDGNDLAAAGLPNLDNLGPVGGGLHSMEEWIDIDSLAQRAKLAAGLMVRIARQEQST